MGNDLTENVGLMYILNETYHCLALDLILYISVLVSSVCCHYPCHHHHNLQLICHQQFQTHLATLWIFHLSFLLNMSSAGAGLKGSCLSLYLPNWHLNVIKYDEYSSSLRFWYLDLACPRGTYFTLVSFGNNSREVGPLWTGHMSAWLSPARSRHNLTFSFGFDAGTKLLHRTAVLSTGNGVIMSSYYNHSRSSLIGLCNA